MQYQNKWFKYINKIRLDEMATRASKEGVVLPTMLEELEPFVSEPATHFITYTADLRGRQRNEGPTSYKKNVEGNEINVPMVQQPIEVPPDHHPADRSGEKWEKSPARPKFGINPGGTYNTPAGIYSYPLTSRIYAQIKNGTIPFASDNAFLTVFRVKPGVKVLSNWDEEYNEVLSKAGNAAASQFAQKEDRLRQSALSDEEYESVLQRLVSPEFFEKVANREGDQDTGEHWSREYDKSNFRVLKALADDSAKVRAHASGEAFYRYFWKKLYEKSEEESQRWESFNLFHKMSGLIGSPVYKKGKNEQWDHLDEAVDRAFLNYLKEVIMSLPKVLEGKEDLRWVRDNSQRDAFRKELEEEIVLATDKYSMETARLKKLQQDFPPIEPLNYLELKFIVWEYAMWCVEARREYGEEWLEMAQVETGESTKPDPLSSKEVKKAERGSTQPDTNLGKLWNVTRIAANGSGGRWARILRNLGIGGIVDYHSPINNEKISSWHKQSDFGLIHPAEPEQALFFKKTDLEVVKTFENKMTPERVKNTTARHVHGLFLPSVNAEFVNKFGRPMDAFDKEVYADHVRYLTWAFQQHALEGSEMAEERKLIEDAVRFRDEQLIRKVRSQLGWLFHPEIICLVAYDKKNKSLANVTRQLEREIDVFLKSQKKEQGAVVFDAKKLQTALMPRRRIVPALGGPDRQYDSYGIHFGDVRIKPSKSELLKASQEVANQRNAYEELLSSFRRHYNFFVKYAHRPNVGLSWPQLRTTAEAHGVVDAEPDIQIDLVTKRYEAPPENALPTYNAMKGVYIKEGTIDSDLRDYFTTLQEEKGRSHSRGIYRFFCMIGYTVEVGDKQRGLDDILQDLRAVENVAIVTVIEGNRRIAERKYIAGIAIKFIPSVPGKVGVPQQIKNRIIGDLRRLKNVERIFRISAGLERVE